MITIQLGEEPNEYWLSGLEILSDVELANHYQELISLPSIDSGLDEPRDMHPLHSEMERRGITYEYLEELLLLTPQQQQQQL